MHGLYHNGQVDRANIEDEKYPILDNMQCFEKKKIPNILV